MISQLNHFNMENKNLKKNKGGRPTLPLDEKKTGRIEVRCTAEQLIAIKKTAKDAGLSVSEYLVKRALNNKIIYNYNTLFQELHAVGTEFSRAGNNINQLAKHANSLNKIGKLDPSVVDRTHLILEDYVKKKDELRGVLRKIIREIGK